MTGWPEFRSEEGCCYGKSAIHTESCPLYFLGAILGKERQKRYDQFEKNTPVFTKVAGGYFQEAADASSDRELKAQSLAFLMGLNYDLSIAKTLREKFSATAFYQRYKTVCAWLGDSNVTPVYLPTKQYRHYRKATKSLVTPLAAPSPTVGK